MLPAASTARTSNVWLPSARPEYEAGEAQTTKGAASTRHSKVEPASLEEKEKLTEAVSTVPDGPESMAVSGGVWSTVKDWLAGLGSGSPLASKARTEKVWVPSASPA